jgi:hypothetical protein
MRFIEIPALITEDIEDPSIVDITEPITVSISGTTMTIDGGSKVSGEATVTLTGDTTVDAFTLQNIRAPSLHKISVKTNNKGNFTYVPNNTVTASSVSTTTKTGSDFEILLITTTGGETYVDFDMADYTSPALYTSNALTGFDISELTSTYGATAKLYKPDGTLLTTVSAAAGSGVNFGYTETEPGDVIYKLEVTDDLGRTSRYDLPRKWISYAMSSPGFEKLELAGNEYTTTTIVPNLTPSSKAKVFRTNNHGYLGINFKIQGRNSTGDDWVDIANADEDDEVLAFGDFLYHRVWVKPTAKATTTVSSSNVVTLTLTDFTEENVTTSFTGADPYDINESTNTYVFEETTKIGTVPFTVTLGGETYTNAVTATTEGTAYDYVTLAFANPTLSLTTSNVTISSAKLYKDDVLFHTYGTESNVVLRSDQTGTYQAIVNDVYYSNRVTPDFTTTRSVSAPQLEFDGYNKLTFFKETLIQNNVIVTDTRTGGAWGCHLNIDANYTGEGYQWKLHKDDSSHSLVPDHDFDDDSGHGIYRYLRYTGTEDLGSWTFYNVNTDDSQGSQDTVLKIYSSNGSNEVTNAGIGSTLWVWSWNMSFSGHLTKSIFTPTSTTLGLPDGTTRDLTTQSNVYIYEPGTYTANVQTSETFAYLSNVATIQTVTQPTLVNTIPITAGDFSGYNYQHEATDTTNTYYEYNMSLNSTGSTYFIAYNWTTKKWFDTNPTDANNTFGISATDTAATSRETTENPKVVYVIGTNNGQIVLESQFINPYFTGPSLTFDGFNKLTIENLTQTSSTLKYGSNTYDTNTASNVYVTDAGEYKLEARDANTFVMSNVYVGAVSQHPSDVVPTLTFDGYNKLTIDNVDTVETATIKKDGAAFATTTSNTVYIRDTGTYTAEVKGSGEYAIELSKEVGTINNAPDWRETQFQLLYSENPNQNDRFGSVVDIDGDYACIGSGYDDTNAVDKGAVYVFHKSNGVWTYQDILQPDSTSEDFAVLNSSLSIHGDTIAAGAQANDTGGNDFGAVYVFRRNGTSWSKEAKLQTNDVQTSDNFGSGVGIYGDYIVGGAYAEDTGGSRAGSAYIFKRTGTIWEQTAKIQSGDQSEDDKFGLNCKIYGDYVIVGAPEEDIGGSEYGAAYIFKRDALSRPTTNVIVLSPADWGSPAQHFHRNPSLDTTTSSFYELVQGTSWGTGTTTDTGHGIELRLNGTNTELYVNSDNNNLDPITVSIGDGTASSSVTLISGQTCTLYKADGTGYSFTVNSGHLFGEVWSKTETLLASDGASGDFFGQSVDIYDGYAIVGASIKDYNDGTNTGGAYIFKKNVDESWTEQAILISDDPIDNYQFGASVYIKGNYAIVGEPGSTNTGGFMYVFERSGSTWTQIKKFQVTNGQDANFGTSVAISGDTILSGALYDDVKDVNTGVCYVFSKTPPGSYVTFDNYNKITLENTNYEDTATVSDPNGSIHEIGTAKTMYVKDAGEYVFKISGTDKYVESNVYVSSVDLAGATTKPIDFDGYNKLTLIDAGSNVSANVTYFSNTYELGSANVLYINGTGTYDLEMSGSNVFALSSNVVSTVDSNPTGTYNTIFNIDGLNSSGKLGASHVGYPISFNAAGTRVVIGEYNIDKAHIYDKVEGSWTLSQTWTKSNGFGKSCAMSDDGNVVVVVENAGTNKLSLFVYENGSWVTKQNQISISGSRDTFGSGLFMSGDGLYLLATDYSYEGSGGKGRNKIYDLSEYSFLERLNFGFSTTAYSWHGDIDRYGNRAIWDDDAADYWRVYKRSGATWSQSTTIAPSNTSGRGPASCDENMVRVALSDTGNSSAGVTIWYRNPSGDTFALEKTITVDNSGCNISMNYAGDRLMITDKTAGDIEIWTRSGTTWTKQKTINPPTFGTLVNFAHTANKSDGYTLAITDETYDSNKGRVYIYSDPITPSLTFDNYNKLSIENLTPTSTTLRFGSNTYDIGTASNVYIEHAGTYKFATGDANTFALVSNVVGAIATGKFDPLDTTSDYSILGSAFTPSTTSDTQSKTSLSNDGTRVLVDNDTGYFIQVYEYSSGSWTQLGSDINYGTSSTSSRISGDGNRVCVGISSSNQVKVYEYSSGSWSQIGTTITGSNGFGTDTSLNYDGTRLMVGASGDYNTRGNQTVWQESGGNWTQLGSTLYCNHNSHPHSLCGGNVDINNDGTVVCAGGYKGHSQDKGCLHVWKYNGSSWTQSFFSEGGNDHHSNYCRLSGDGKVVMYSHDRWNEPRGRVNFYENTSGASWSQIGGYLEDKKLGDLSNDGKTVVVGKSDASIDSQVYRFDGSAWVQLGSNLEHTSTTLSISSDGSTVAIGNSTSGANKVSVYKGTTPSPSLTYDTSNKLSIENLTPTSTTLTDPNGSSFDIGTASNVYIRDSGKYSIASKDANTFVLASNTVTGTPTGTTYVYDSNTFTTPSQTYDTTKTITVKNVPSTLTDVAGKIYKGSTAYPIHATTSSSNVIIKNTGSYVSVFTTATQAFLTNAIGVTTQPTTTSDDTTIEDEGFIPGSTAVPDETSTDAPSVTLDATDTTVTDPTLDLDFTTQLPRTLKRYNGVTNSSIGARFNRHESRKKRIEKSISIPTSFSAELTANNASSPTTLTVTVANSKFVINGDETPTLGFIRGETYTFDQSDASNSGHPLVLATSADGATQYTTGWTASGTPGTDGSHAFIVPYDVPDTIYYKCSIHPNMGGEIHTTFGNVFSLGDFTVAANTHVSGEYTLATNYDGTTSNLYVNGDLITQTTPSPAISAGVKDFILGKEFDGYVKNFKFWNYAKRFFATIIAFHHDTFANSGDPYNDGSVTVAAANGHVFSDTDTSISYTWGTLGSANYNNDNTTYTWTPASAVTAKVLMVAGGGGGGNSDNINGGGGGGGAGGLVYNSSVSLSGQKTITVGGPNSTVRGDGTGSTFTGLTSAVGGGKGAGAGGGAGNGGSGGGAFRNGTGGAGTEGQGYAGGDGNSSGGNDQGGSGGGGAGGGGAGANGANGANGGVGLDYSSVFGTAYGDSGWFASGGGGGFHSGSPGTASNGGGGNGGSSGGSAGGQGQKHTGGGGGGGSIAASSNNGSYGGSGIVLIKY